MRYLSVFLLLLLLFILKAIIDVNMGWHRGGGAIPMGVYWTASSFLMYKLFKSKIFAKNRQDKATPEHLNKETECNKDVQTTFSTEKVANKTNSISFKTVKLDESTIEELKELEKMSPKAAAIAMEDSRDGEIVRDRLSLYGAVSALDRADIIMLFRERELEKQAQKMRGQ